MNRRDYRAAFDAVDFSADFEERTLQKLAALRQASEKEQIIMPMNRVKKTALLIAAAVALLAVSVSAAVVWLTPAQVAEELDNPALAAAFEGKDAIVLNETQTAGDYTVTLGGLVSGTGLSRWYEDAEETRTYAVVSVSRTDGTPLTEDNYDISASGTFTVTPLVAGYPPQSVNIFSLDGSCASFLQDGQAYYLMDTQSVEMFADHTVYLAVYQGFVPSYSMFSAAEDGTLAMREDVVGCMFTLPLDVNKADPEAVDAFFQETGLFRELFTDEELAAREEETAQEDARITAPGTYGSVEVIEVPGHGLVTTMQAQAAAEYEAFMERETARLEQEAAAGTLSEADYEAAVQEMADSLAGLWDGTRTPTWHANPDDTEILQTQPSAAALAEQAGSMG